MTRIKGQEVTVAIVANNIVTNTITAIKSIEMTVQLEKLQEGYLGETTDRYDSIFKGMGGSIEFHAETAAIFDFIKTVIDKARRRVAGQTINILATMTFPDGTRARVIIPNAEFGEIPINAGGREEYVTFSLDFGASEMRVIRT